MREEDRNTRIGAKSPVRRFHRGAMGQVLERYLDARTPGARRDYQLAELEQLWAAAARHDPAIGLHLFAQFTPRDLHVLTQLCLYCVDVAQAVSCWARYAPLASDMESLALVEDSEGLAVELRIDAPERLARHVIEHYDVMALTQLRRGTGIEVRPARACFSFPRPAYHAQYRTWFGDDIRFGCEHNRLYLDPPTLALPMLGHNPGMFDLLTSELDRRLARQRQFSGWAAKVADGVRHCLARGQTPSLENQAEALHHSPRTLRRRLEEQGLTFRQLLDLVRAELEQHLELQGLGRGEIAERLGYADLAAYQYARKRWRAVD